MARKKLDHLSLNFTEIKELKTFAHEGFIAGIAPNLRGPY